MALISCPECGKEISDAARSCPHCGYAIREAAVNQIKRTPLTEKKPSRASGVFLCTGGMVMVLGSLLLFVVLLPVGVLGLVIRAMMILAGSFLCWISFKPAMRHSVPSRHVRLCFLRTVAGVHNACIIKGGYRRRTLIFFH